MECKYRISEIYPCLQGEGVSIGRPAILVRFFGCNLTCSWCDSKHTWAKNSLQGVSSINASELKILIKSVAHSISQNITSIIFTGGEPLLQAFHRVVADDFQNWHIEIESNCTLMPTERYNDFSEELVQKFQWNLSPKLANSGQDICGEAMKYWAGMARKNSRIFFKFVVTQDESKTTVKQIQGLISQYQLPEDRILLMAEGTTKKSQNNAGWLHDICLQYGFRYSPRLHVVLFGNKKKV